MQRKKILVNGASTVFYFDAPFSQIDKLVEQNNQFFLTDEAVFAAHTKLFRNRQTIVIPAGEEQKTMSAAEAIIAALLGKNADRSSVLIGVGGGVICDIAGFVAGIFMRGIAFILFPTTLLAMCDAAVGGKNGVNIGGLKNMAGTIKQPDNILYHYAFLKTLPTFQWQMGFAEVIKHACIQSAAMFRTLQLHSLAFYRKDFASLTALIQKNVQLKINVVQRDEQEKGERKILNFGHSLAHALERSHNIAHGQAVAVGMVAAAIISQWKLGFNRTAEVIQLVEKYKLPPMMEFDVDEVVNLIQSDKKSHNGAIDYILLAGVGKPQIVAVSFAELRDFLNRIAAL